MDPSETAPLRVLVVEDDADTAADIIAEMIEAGFAVEHATTGPEGLERASTGAFDVVSLDRLLPGLDGLAVLAALRERGIRTPVVVVSALASVDERIRGLRTGGDDYLVKPFSPAELRARIEALVRRIGEPVATRLTVEDLELDLLARRAVRGQRVLDLAPRELRLLEYLVRHAGQVVTRGMLFEDVWNYRFDPGTNLVDVHLGRLRRKVDGPGDRPLIETVRGKGYLLRSAARC